MTIYGLGLLAACYLAGQLIGEVLGRLIGIDANVGGVGFAMILLILATDKLNRKNLMPPATQQGVLFWTAMYIPVIVAMSATQNVIGAFSGGLMAIVAATIPTAAMFLLVPVLSRMRQNKEKKI
ncbi:MAG TPA: malonate transporter subunit MadL [Chryseolinea sp.]|nr:malonate transporter subunit MadL [Chryseolinea sp.]